MDCVNRERALNGCERTQAGVAPLKFLHHQPERGVTHARAAMIFQIRRKKSELAYSWNEFVGKFAGAMTRYNFRHRLFLHKTSRPIPRRAFVVGKKFFDGVIIE